MGRKKRKDKEVARLRREVEILRAQLSSRTAGQLDGLSVVEKRRFQKFQAGTKRAIIDIHSDLRKTIVLTIVCLGILLALYLTQFHWSLPFF